MQAQRVAKVAEIEAVAKQQEEAEARSRESAEQGKPAEGQSADLDAAEKEYYALEKQFLSQLGLAQDDSEQA